MADDTGPRINGNSHQITNGSSRSHDHTYLRRRCHPSNGDFKPGTVHPNLEATTSTLDPIAICGLGIRLPGGVRSAEDFWDLLINGKDAQGPIRSDRYKIDSFNGALGKKGAIKTQKGYFLDDDLTSLDTSFFSMSKNELEKSDPQQRQLLEVTKECLESAGEINYRGKMVGCYVGTFGEDWLQMSARETQHSGGYILTGHGDLMISNRVSYEYDLRGPSMVIKTGCSASLVALHEACRALHSGDCNGAIVAGTSLIMGPATTAAMTQEGILSPEGSCKTFDAAADGFARAEAINAIYIKKLSDALRDNNPIRAIIRNTGTNSDGKSQGLMTPSSEAHEALIRKVYSDSGLIPSETGYVECHGTGTPTGDPLEVAAVGRVFGEKGVHIGSVKPNVGHSEGASGITSLIKVILCLQHGTIPPNIKFSTPNPKINFRESRLVVPTKATPWPQDRSKRASINSFGIGGSNAHIILESSDAYVPTPRKAFEIDIASKLPQLLVFSANTQESLRRQVLNNTTYLEMYLDRVLDMAYTLNQRREHHVYRTFCTVGDDRAMGKAAAVAKVPIVTPDLVMTFSGQGAQWPTMGRELVLKNSEFRSDIGAMDSILQSLQYPPAWSIKDELFKTKTSQIHRAEMAQPLCTAIQIALVNVFRRSGIQPVAVVGHSSGEIAAAYAARAISFREAVIISYYRGYVAKKPSAGSMAAVGLGADAASKFLKEGVVIACENSPKSITLSGDVGQLDKVVAAIKESKPDVLARVLKVDMAYHSHHMVSLGKEYRRLVEEELARRHDSSLHTEEFSTSRHLDTLFFSSATGEVIEDSEAVNPEYWQKNLTSLVRFDSAVRRMLQRQRNNVFLEIGPHSTLAGPLRQICSEVGLDCPYIPTMIRNKDCAETLLSAWGQLYQQGIPFSFEPLTRGGSVLPNLPSYPWDHSASYWYESRLSKDWRFRKHGYHGLLGVHVGESTIFEPSWRNVLSLEDEPWLYDHKIRGDVVFPFAGYAAMAGECIRQVSGINNGYSLRHVVVHSALVLTDSKSVEMITVLRPHRLTDSMDSDWFDFTISSNSGSTWMRNCEGQVKPRQADLARCENFHIYPREVNPSRWYAAMTQIGFNYGPEFSGLTKITSSTTENLSVGEIENPYQEAPYVFHPTAIDACLQLLLVAMSKGIGRNFGHVAVPTRIEEIEVARSASTMMAKAGNLTASEAPGIDCVSGGRTCLRLRGVYLTPMDNEEDLDSAWDRHAAARLEWAPDFDFFDVASLFKPPESKIEETMLQEEMTLLCMVESAERLRLLETDQWHFRKYRDWLHKEVGRAQNGLHPVVRNCKQLVNLNPSVRRDLIEERLKQLSSMGSKAAVATGIKRISDNIEALFTGTADTLDTLMQGDVLTKIYNVVSFGHGEFVRMLSHTKPNLRVLEVGAGTGGTTVSILEDLVDKDGYPLYSLYSFTDVSAGFFPQAKERFSHASNMDYRVFDISRNPIEQGFEVASYDLILAPNVVHATPSLHETLCNLRPLLRPHGHLVLTELSALVRAPNYIFGNFSGWWLGEADGRPDEPYVSVDRWDQELKAANFTGVDTAVFDAEQPYQYCAAIVSQPLAELDGGSSRRTITILCDEETNEITKNLVAEIELLGIDYLLSKFGDRPPQGECIITTIDLESCFFENISENKFRAFQDLLSEQHHRTILWLTRPSQILCDDPRSAQTVGVARTIRSELALSFVTLEIDPREKEFGKKVMQVFGKITSRKDDGTLAPDPEYAVDDGVIKVGRYHPFSLAERATPEK
ncbi:hypothetical protein HO173_000826 [Letharia columbiana]|uniref:Polyketide synthase n=1 Tax=Letharia columbiana TaxID=112416 RepID=A0A8H6G5Q2_9LECA|nr:uncharacterized protein HO173_000826 [Letharia columbiana]KAF6241032.1 hypothetical protein HO173_000826 [Letharia columbiana]